MLIVTHRVNSNTWYEGVFESYGCDVKYIIATTYGSQRDLKMRIKRKLSLNVDLDMDKKRDSLFEEIQDIAQSFKPNIILVVHGIHLREIHIEELKKKYFVAMFMSDKLALYPQIMKYAKYYDVVYTYALDDYETFKNAGVNCKYFPSLGNSRVYKYEELDRDIDVSFVGSLYPKQDYGNRYELLYRLIHDFPTKNIRIYGKCASIKMPIQYFKWITNSFVRERFLNRTITEKECNTVYNRSKICLCIEPMTGNGWSSRLANMLRTNSFVLTTSNDAVEMMLKRCLITFKDYDDLKDKIEYFLNHKEERESIAEYGFKNYERQVSSFYEMDRYKSLLDEYQSRLNLRNN